MEHLCPRGPLTAPVSPCKADDTLGSIYAFHPRKGDSVLMPKSTYAKMVTVRRHSSLPRWRRGTSGTRFPNQGSPRGQAEETALGVQVRRERLQPRAGGGDEVESRQPPFTSQGPSAGTCGGAKVTSSHPKATPQPLSPSLPKLSLWREVGGTVPASPQPAQRSRHPRGRYRAAALSPHAPLLS